MPWLKYYLHKKALHPFSFLLTTSHTTRCYLLFPQLLRMALDFSLDHTLFFETRTKASIFLHSPECG